MRKACMQNSVDSHSSTSQKPLQDKHRVISIALLDNHINMDLLRDLSKQLQESFAYFEILILNPLFDMFDKNHKDTIKQQNTHITPPPPRYKSTFHTNRI